LLCALTIEACGSDRNKLTRWIAESVYAADRSPWALRGAVLSLASLTNEVDALVAMRSKWLVADSLLVSDDKWCAIAPRGFEIVIGNPPWEKVKLTRHEYLKSLGDERHYGAEVNAIDVNDFDRQRNGVADYARQLMQRYPFLARGEPDLYVAFTTLFEKLCKPGGVMAAILPAGLIRSQGTEAVRKHLFTISESISIAVIENRARFFSIDSRFKFLMLACTKANNGSAKRDAIELMHAKGTSRGLEEVGSARIGRDSLFDVRPDLSLPEVRNALEWRIYRRMVQAGVPWADKASGWRPEFCREVDMTRDRTKFRTNDDQTALPIIEGRMVQQHRFGAKGYVSGSGRRALWRTFALGEARLAPQFRIACQDIPEAVRRRSETLRAGFCDITGQTNERSMMAALIPPGVVCGNKVPTVLFVDDPTEDRLYVWAAIVNSLPFDWTLRRIVTTTVNYFLLVSLPMPRLAKDGLPWRRLCAAARELRELDGVGYSREVTARAARLRAEIDSEISVAYGLELEDLEIMVKDFPLLDRDQPALPNEQRSTVTTDLILSTTAKRMKRNESPWRDRFEAALDLGADGYIPSEFVQMEEPQERVSDVG
jgi:hypothetical protein